MKPMRNVALVISAMLLLSSQAFVSAVAAQDNQPTIAVQAQAAAEANVSARMRSEQSVIEANIATSQPVSQSTEATILLKDAKGNTINSTAYTMQAGQSRFSVWFDLTNLKVSDYSISVSVPDKEKAFSGSSAPIHFDGKPTKNTPETEQKSSNPAPANNQPKPAASSRVTSTEQVQSVPSEATSANHMTRSNHRSDKALKASQASSSGTPSAAKSIDSDEKDKGMLSDSAVQDKEQKGFPWLLSSLIALTAAALLALIVKAVHRK
ncbi:membrane protein [Streptococcus equi]|uniref:Membrane protein n=3 Tax=Streptococcus equi subsp. zooepidemicus TaxID=40041 RepID=A0ABP2XAI3_STRSZ|nr:membrane protein [Streptococcus equi]KIS16290.1 membrane protein [Streptococcus equi subsp. zooepidemicus Sz4is]ACG63079.1 hypothetical membrane associated protein [Streptococcus equi subsp. zooepidemicus MGCS10565]EQB23053.1 membrane protein [Streptococcus equi subsp. zooepidemicus SzS31A1]KIS04655.1 membrane protein [Streptococcus equi subsp. zooepidemicus Sz12is]MCD3368696.1 hypothetical protein [Streptococcus equi subsp. zooepidemicus]